MQTVEVEKIYRCMWNYICWKTLVASLCKDHKIFNRTHRILVITLNIMKYWELEIWLAIKDKKIIFIILRIKALT